MRKRYGAKQGQKSKKDLMDRGCNGQKCIEIENESENNQREVIDKAR